MASDKYSETIRVSNAVELATHQGDPPPCVCSGISFEEGRGKGGAWVRYHCHHCAAPGPWVRAADQGDSQHRSTFLAGLNHSQRCWTRPQSIARSRSDRRADYLARSDYYSDDERFSGDRRS